MEVDCIRSQQMTTFTFPEASKSENDTQSLGEASNVSNMCSTQGSGPSRRQILQQKTSLEVFAISAPDDVRDRFQDVKNLFDKSLYDHLSKNGERPAPVSITLQYLGEEENSATPWIVVQCDKTVAKQARQWFNTESVKAYCKPEGNNSDLPKFDVYVHDQAPCLLSKAVYGIGLLGPDSNTFTVCGRLLRINDPSDGRLATLGGLIKVSWETKFAIYGITVRHVFRDYTRLTSETDPQDGTSTWSEAGSIDHEFILSQGGSVVEDSDNDSQYLFELKLPTEDIDVTSKDGALALEIATCDSTRVTKVGCQFQYWSEDQSSTLCETDLVCSQSKLKRSPLLDWELITIEDSSKLWPNLLSSLEGPQEMHFIDDMAFETGLGRDVCILSGVSGPRRGTVSSVASFITLTDLQRPVETYCVKLADSLGLEPGDSGSWVIDSSSYQVYGQVVASDALRNVYVVPFASIAREIKQSLNAKSITLPTCNELDFCAFTGFESSQREDSKIPESFEEKYGQFDLDKLEIWNNGNAEIPGIIQPTSAGSFVPPKDVHRTTPDKTQPPDEDDRGLTIGPVL